MENMDGKWELQVGRCPWLLFWLTERSLLVNQNRQCSCCSELIQAVGLSPWYAEMKCCLLSDRIW